MNETNDYVEEGYSSVTSLAWHPNGRWLAMNAVEFDGGTWLNNVVSIIDTENDTLIASCEYLNNTSRVVWMDEQHMLGFSHGFCRYKLDCSEELLLQVRLVRDYWDYDAAQQRLVYTSYEGLHLHDLAANQPLLTKPGSFRWVKFRPDGRQIVVQQLDPAQIHLLDATTLAHISSKPGSFRWVKFRPDGRQIVVQQLDPAQIHLLDATTLAHTSSIEVEQLHSPVAAWSPNGKYLAVYEHKLYYTGRWIVWDVEASRVVFERRQPGTLCHLAWHPNSRLFGVGGRGLLEVCDVETHQTLLSERVGSERVGTEPNIVAWSKDGVLAVSTLSDRVGLPQGVNPLNKVCFIDRRFVGKL